MIMCPLDMWYATCLQFSPNADRYISKETTQTVKSRKKLCFMSSTCELYGSQRMNHEHLWVQYVINSFLDTIGFSSFSVSTFPEQSHWTRVFHNSSHCDCLPNELFGAFSLKLCDTFKAFFSIQSYFFFCLVTPSATL